METFLSLIYTYVDIRDRNVSIPAHAQMTFDPVEYLMQILLVQCQGILSTVSMLLQSKRTFVCKIMVHPYIGVCALLVSFIYTYTPNC